MRPLCRGIDRGHAGSGGLESSAVRCGRLRCCTTRRPAAGNASSGAYHPRFQACRRRRGVRRRRPGRAARSASVAAQRTESRSPAPSAPRSAAYAGAIPRRARWPRTAQAREEAEMEGWAGVGDHWARTASRSGGGRPRRAAGPRFGGGPAGRLGSPDDHAVGRQASRTGAQDRSLCDGPRRPSMGPGWCPSLPRRRERSERPSSHPAFRSPRLGQQTGRMEGGRRGLAPLGLRLLSAAKPVAGRPAEA